MDRIAQQSGTDTEYFMGDALDSVRQLTNSEGDVTLARAYDPYGNTTLDVGSEQTAYGYTGEYTDSTGMIYLRARYYDPAIGEFISKDTMQGDDQNPETHNIFTYAKNNPVNYIDPSGNAYCDDAGNCYMYPGQAAPQKSASMPDINLYYLVSSSSDNSSSNCARVTLTKILDVTHPNASFEYLRTSKTYEDQKLTLSSLKDLVYSISNSANWKWDDTGDITFFENPGFEYLGGVRIFGGIELIIDNGSSITIEPITKEIGTGNISINPDKTTFQFGNSSIQKLASTIGIKIRNSQIINPWMFEVTADYSCKVSKQISITGEIGIEVVNRSDNELLAGGFAIGVILISEESVWAIPIFSGYAETIVNSVEEGMH